MDALMEFLTSKEVGIVILIAIAICIIGTIYFLIEKVYKNNKNVNNNNMENKIIEMEENRVVIKPVIEQIIDPKVNEKSVAFPAVKEENSAITQAVTKDEKVEAKPLVIPIEEFSTKQKEQTKEEIEELMPSVENIYTEVKEKIKNQEELIYTEIEPNQEEAKEVLRKATEELMRTQEMQLQENIDLTKYEEEQEENAIISIQELMKKSKQLYEQNEVTQYKDEGNEPISILDLEQRMNKIEVATEQLEQEEIVSPVQTVENQVNNEPVKTISLDDFNTVSIEDAYKEDRVFKSSPVISPIFGIENKQPTNNIELENTANYEKLDEEIKKTNEFLATLKELQKKLD